MKDPYKSTLFLLVTSLGILHIEAAIALSLIGIMLFIQYNAYYRRVYEPYSITYVRNAQFLLVLMSLITESAELAETFARNVLFWGKPAQSVLMMNFSLFSCVFVYLSLKFLPLRWILVASLWLAALKNSEFFNTFGVAIIRRAQRVDWNAVKAKTFAVTEKFTIYFLDEARKVCNELIELYQWPVKPLLLWLKSVLESTFTCLVWLCKNKRVKRAMKKGAVAGA